MTDFLSNVSTAKGRWADSIDVLGVEPAPRLAATEPTAHLLDTHSDKRTRSSIRQLLPDRRSAADYLTPPAQMLEELGLWLRIELQADIELDYVCLAGWIASVPNLGTSGYSLHPKLQEGPYLHQRAQAEEIR